MGLLRSYTSRHTTAESKDEQDVKLGIQRSATDPSTADDVSPGSRSGQSSGTSTPRRKTASMDLVRNMRERPGSAIPKYHVLAEQVHRFKMRNCCGAETTPEEAAGIKEMKRWDWKHCGHPGARPLPVGPMNETWEDNSPDLERVGSQCKPDPPTRKRAPEGVEADGTRIGQCDNTTSTDGESAGSSGATSLLELDSSTSSKPSLEQKSEAQDVGGNTSEKTTTVTVKPIPRSSTYHLADPAYEESDTDDDAPSWYQTEWSIRPLARGRGLSMRLGMVS